jgi:hypothetical protein
MDIAYLDFAKAFDKVPHQRLLKKIRGYGIQGRVYSWIEDFLTDRQQLVNINGQSSNWAPVTSGIPQGSVLGPVLFVIFINDMPQVVDSHIQMFADDAKLFSKVDNDEDIATFQTDLNSLAEWAKKWQLQFNVNKC